MRGRLTGQPVVPTAGFGTQAERTPKGLLFTIAAEADAHDPFALAGKVGQKVCP